LGPDGPTIGGYPKIAVVVDADLDRLGQLRPGDLISFEQVDLVTARALRTAYETRIERMTNLLRLSGEPARRSVPLLGPASGSLVSLAVGRLFGTSSPTAGAVSEGCQLFGAPKILRLLCLRIRIWWLASRPTRFKVFFGFCPLRGQNRGGGRR